MSSLGIFDKETKTYKKVAGTAEAAAIDDALSSTSTNPVQNKVVKDALDHKLNGYAITYNVPANAGGWHKIAEINGYFNFDLYVTGGWYNQPKSNAHFQIQNTDGNIRIVQLSGLIFSNSGISKLRMIRVTDNKDIWILEEYSHSSDHAETFKFTIAGCVMVTPLDGSVDTTTDFKDSVSLDVSDIPTGTVITTGNIDSHLTDLKYGEVAGGKNLLNPNKTIIGELSEGIATSGENYVSDYIPIKSNTSYSISNCTQGSNEVAWYTSDKTYISRSFKTPVISPSNASYVRIEYVDNINAQLEEGSVATSYEPYIPSVKMLAEEKADKSETTVNLLKPTLQTTTQNGVTCTNNGDGTYTLNGTNTYTGTIYFALSGNLKDFAKKMVNKKFKLIGCPINGGSRFDLQYEINGSTDNGGCYDFGDGGVAKNDKIASENIESAAVFIAVRSGCTVDNIVFKPMLTTNLSATYDDFVPYTGNTGRLNGDVAALKAEVVNNKTVVDAAMSDTSTNPVQNKVVTSNLNDIRKETTVNLLNPTLETSTIDGIKCTNNGDGTYTLNGTVSTPSNRAIIVLQYCGDMIKKHLNENLLLIGCPKHDESIDMNLHLDAGISHAADSGNGRIFKFSQVAGDIPIKIEIGTNGTTVNNLVFKPMLTTNLNATYDDFVPYTGDTGKLNSDVAVLAKKIPMFERNSTVFASGGLILTGDTAGRFGAISDEWSDSYGRKIQFSNARDAKTHCSVWVDIPAHSVCLFEAYTNGGEPVVVKLPLFFYNKGDTVKRETISCDISTSVGATATIIFNPIVIKNV